MITNAAEVTQLKIPEPKTDNSSHLMEMLGWKSKKNHCGQPSIESASGSSINFNSVLVYS
jgi:hypothetical protein